MASGGGALGKEVGTRASSSLSSRSECECECESECAWRWWFMEDIEIGELFLLTSERELCIEDIV